MSQFEVKPDPAFREQVRATGHGEVWTHTREDLKMQQFGWRCTNKESSYSNKTLTGNWNEERCNYDKALQNIPLPSQYGHYYTTTAYDSYSKVAPQVNLDDPEERKKLRRIAGRVSRAFPAHQPEFDSEELREICDAFMTTSRMAYIDPKLRREPLPADLALAKPR